MNKAKFLLSAVAVVAVFATVSASKALPGQRVFTTDVPGPCPNSVPATLQVNNQPIGTAFVTIQQGQECLVNTKYYNPL